MEPKEECVELKTLMYKTMLQGGNSLKDTHVSNNMSNIENFLQEEKQNNMVEPWSKLNKTIKSQKLLEYATKTYQQEHQLNEEETQKLVLFFQECLNKKKLGRVKDVVYDKVEGGIKSIPALQFNKSNKHFTLKHLDKQHVTTLKSLPPKKMANKRVKAKESPQPKETLPKETPQPKETLPKETHE
jgi:hypothetical protein